jgi:alpha-ketoglutarate-dependent 2,4-dichlorophenoxyacetate dioxygenase
MNALSDIKIRPLRPTFAAELIGLDISKPLDPPTVAAVREVITQHGVVVMPGQAITDEQQMAFAEYFGCLERYSLSYRSNQKLRLKYPEMVDVSNLDPESGKPQDRAHRLRMINIGNRLWHIDSSFRLPAGALSMLHAHTIPPKDGQTEFSDLRSAYESLPSATKDQIENLEAEHSLIYSRAMMGFDGFAPEEKAALPPVRQPVVRVHPWSGQKALYLGSHASHIPGMPVPEGRVLIMNLNEHAAQRVFVYRHEWRVGDLVIWDNRCTMHRALAYDESYPRDMRRVTTSDINEVAHKSAQSTSAAFS